MMRLAGLLLSVCVLPAVLEAQVVAQDYSNLYEVSKPAIVQITTDDGSGSGFLVSPFGHIATNYHVIRHSRYLAVQFVSGLKVRAAVVAVNPHYDMALLKVNSTVVEGVRPLPILPAEKEETVKVGIPVVAIGSPLNQNFLMTQGILSKVAEATLLGDFLLQAGNSGGPLMNGDGEVIGINTFGESSIGGAVRIAALRSFFQSPELVIQSIVVEPPPDELPSVSPVRYPIAVLNQKIQTEPLDLDTYKLRAGDFLVTAITPVMIGKIQVMQEKMRADNREERRGKDISDPAYHGIQEPFYEWHRSTETALDHAITFDIRPDIGPTKRSRAAKIVAPFLIFGMGKPEIEFKGEFLDFRVYRDGELVEPIMPGRSVIQGNSDPKKNSFVDQAYAGSYIYAPEEFMTGNEFRLQIVDARQPNAIHKEMILPADSKLIRQLRSDFTITRDMLISRAR